MAAACGAFHTHAVSEEGELWGWGSGSDAQLGLATPAASEDPARRHRRRPARDGGPELFGARVVSIACGRLHAAAVAADGGLWTWGHNTEGQLGHGDEQPRARPARLQSIGPSPVVHASCGSCHTLALAQDGTVWTWGEGVWGQLGKGDTANCSVPAKLAPERFGGERAVVLAAGSSHSVAVTELGGVCTWGYGGDGCLGHGDEFSRYVPTRLARFGPRVVLAAAGDSHTVCVGEDGALWAWGWGALGQLGLGDNAGRLEPARVGGGDDTFGGSRVLLAACGENHTLCVGEDGTLWSCGSGAFGRLGHGDGDEGDRLVPCRIAGRHFGGKRVVTAAAGVAHSTALTEDGRLYTWGRGYSYPGSPNGLGHGDVEHRFVPTLVSPHNWHGARLGRCQPLPPQHALAFAMGTHSRLGAALPGGGGSRQSQRRRGKPADESAGGCLYSSMPKELVQRVIEACVSWPEGSVGSMDGLVRLLGGGKVTRGSG